jgi:hypothetical protein
MLIRVVPERKPRTPPLTSSGFRQVRIHCTVSESSCFTYHFTNRVWNHPVAGAPVRTERHKSGLDPTFGSVSRGFWANTTWSSTRHDVGGKRDKALRVSQHPTV